MADPNNDSFASEAGGKDLNAKLVPAPVQGGLLFLGLRLVTVGGGGGGTVGGAWSNRINFFLPRRRW